MTIPPAFPPLPLRLTEETHVGRGAQGLMLGFLVVISQAGFIRMWVLTHEKERPQLASSIVILVQSLRRVWLFVILDCSTPGSSVLHSLPELAQIHVHWVGDAIQPSHLLLSPSPPAFNLFQHQGLFQWVSSSHQVTKVIGASASALVLPMNIQDWFPLGLTGWISLQSKGLSRVLSNTTVQKHQFFSAQPSLWSSSHTHTWLLEITQLWLSTPLSAKILSLTRSQLIAQSPVSIQWLPTKHKERTQNRWEHNVFNSVPSFQMAKSCDKTSNLPAVQVKASIYKGFSMSVLLTLEGWITHYRDRGGGGPVCRGMFNSTPRALSLDVTAPAQVWQPQVSPDIITCSHGAEITPS